MTFALWHFLPASAERDQHPDFPAQTTMGFSCHFFLLPTLNEGWLVHCSRHPKVRFAKKNLLHESCTHVSFPHLAGRQEGRFHSLIDGGSWEEEALYDEDVYFRVPPQLRSLLKLAHPAWLTTYYYTRILGRKTWAGRNRVGFLLILPFELRRLVHYYMRPDLERLLLSAVEEKDMA